MGVGIRGRWGWSWGVDERGGDGAASLTVATALSFSYQQLPRSFFYIFLNSWIREARCHVGIVTEPVFMLEW